jgi:hypothetical protein
MVEFPIAMNVSQMYNPISEHENSSIIDSLANDKNARELVHPRFSAQMASARERFNSDDDRFVDDKNKQDDGNDCVAISLMYVVDEAFTM